MVEIIEFIPLIILLIVMGCVGCFFISVLYDPDYATPQDTIRARIILRNSGKVEIRFELFFLFTWFKFDTYRYKTDDQYENSKDFNWNTNKVWLSTIRNFKYIEVDNKAYGSKDPKELIEFFLNFHKEQKRIHKERIKGKRIIKERILQ